MVTKHRSVLALFFVGALCANLFAQTPVNFKVAFIGDTGHDQDFQNVLDLMAAEGTDAVVQAGDLAYSSGGVNEFRTRIENTLGTNFPYFAAAGNHDDSFWGAYQAFLEPWATANGIVWDGDFGRQSSHEFQGINIVLVAPGDVSGDHGGYIRDNMPPAMRSGRSVSGTEV